MLLEDEAPALEILQNYLGHFEDLELLSHFTSPFKAQAYLAENEVDLLFLDIQLPGLNGLDFLRTLSNPPLVVITSAYSEHGVEAYEEEVFDYLLKPYSLERFSKVINRVREELLEENSVIRDSEYLIFRVERKDKKVTVEDILYAESQKEYVKVVTRDEEFLTKMSTGELAGLLPKDGFLRVHRSFLVNRKTIRAFGANSIDIGMREIPLGRLFKREAYEKWSRAND